MDWVHITFAIRSALLDAPSNHNDARNQSYRFGLEDVIVGTHIYRKLMVAPIMCKFVLFGPFYFKIGLDCRITMVK